MSWIPVAASALSGIASFFGSRSAARAQEKMLREAMAQQERMRAKFLEDQQTRSEELKKVLGEYAAPFHEDSKRLSSAMTNELENHERDRMSPDQIMNHPMAKSVMQQASQRMRPMLARSGLYGSSVGEQMMQNAMLNSGVDTMEKFNTMSNKTRESIASSYGSGLSQTQKMPEAFASGVSGFANTQANALGNVETGYERNMAGFGQNRADVQGQKYKEYGNIASGTIGNMSNAYMDKIKYDRNEPFRAALLKSMQGGEVH